MESFIFMRSSIRRGPHFYGSKATFRLTHKIFNGLWERTRS